MTEDPIRERIRQRQNAQIPSGKQSDLASYMQEAENMLGEVCKVTNSKPDWKAFHEEVEAMWFRLEDLRGGYLCLPEYTEVEEDRQ